MCIRLYRGESCPIAVVNHSSSVDNDDPIVEVYTRD